MKMSGLDQTSDCTPKRGAPNERALREARTRVAQRRERRCAAPRIAQHQAQSQRDQDQRQRLPCKLLEEKEHQQQCVQDRHQQQEPHNQTTKCGISKAKTSAPSTSDPRRTRTRAATPPR
ncbi:hypothetical protein SPRG_21909 [Saprolegnia parasitica CBS 223.65]|uniref:Uncharacterized protein n=1 Tax=Saprolegnia parasitica (strain CBS 223.65) TaxID=695850 RepID=A0A067BNV6_SAPPC|nr:hypothetical protein SPRG_21909 [Saprolegnia parasitica CBS 223.65]KDO16382.1 hypothetical protein SPRG_21909 [Saprolegnia parasitica CBS 223.65]|eukprot:XP_012212910.1 hypothetical protein SPRG_21909 [Saprolegnia parasitica CBS 223.65]